VEGGLQLDWAHSSQADIVAEAAVEEVVFHTRRLEEEIEWVCTPRAASWEGVAGVREPGRELELELALLLWDAGPRR